MNIYTRLSLLALILLLLSPVMALAEKRYISDTLIVSLRESGSLSGEVIAYLRSGDLLEVLEENDDGFILVQTASGDKGWIQKKYTIDELPKDMIIAGLKEQVTSLQTKVEAMEASATTVKSSAQVLKGQLADKDKEISRLQEMMIGLKEQATRAENSYEDLRRKSQAVEEIVAERDKLREQLRTIDQEVALLRVENAELIQTDRLLWFLAGFGVFLVGWIMGKVSRKSRRSSLSM